MKSMFVIFGRNKWAKSFKACARKQLNILRKKLSEDFEGDGKYEGLLAEFYGSYGIKHDVWRDLVTMDRERVPKDILSSVEEMDAIKRIKEYDVEELTREACKESLNHIKIMEASEAANLAKRALENFPDLSEYVFRIALEAKEDKRDFILDVIAIEAPEPLKRIEIDKAEKLAYKIKAPNAKAVLFGRLSSHYRDLASRDKRFLPYLARTLSSLGNALYEKGMLDDAIERYEEALKVMEPLSDRPWLWDIISGSHIGIALSLLERDKKGAAEHLCAALKMLTDERAPKTYYSKRLLEICISHLKEIPEELIPEECRKKLVDILRRQS
jgi:tetratricopeptide (TPR) repeat protein